MFNIYIAYLIGIVVGCVMTRIIAFLKQRKKEPRDTIADQILFSLKFEPEKWSADKHEIYHLNGLTIWISNRDYADLTIGTKRLGNEEQRKELRKEIDKIVDKNIFHLLGKK